MTRGRVTTAGACTVAAAASLLLFAAGCTDVVNAGTVIHPQTVDAADTGGTPDGPRTLEEICTSTGGHVEVHSCCDSDDFASLCQGFSCCSVGAPGVVKKDVRLCICPEHFCFSPMSPSPGFRAGCNPEVMSVPRPDGAMSLDSNGAP